MNEQNRFSRRRIIGGLGMGLIAVTAPRVLATEPISPTSAYALGQVTRSNQQISETTLQRAIATLAWISKQNGSTA